MATVDGIVRQHGGFVDVHSEPGKGSKFRTFFPASKTPRAASLRVEDAKAEDHEGLHWIALETLPNLGYHVVLAAAGVEAVRAFQKHWRLIKLALPDVIFPKLNGIQMHASIPMNRKELPIIFAAGYSADITLLRKVPQQGGPVPQKLGHRACKVREALDYDQRGLFPWIWAAIREGERCSIQYPHRSQFTVDLFLNM